MEFLKTVFSYSFAVRALVCGILVSLCSSLLGVSLVLKRYSMLGDGLSHVAFGSAAVALACGAAPLKVSVPVVIIAAFLLLRVSESGKIKGDAAIALVSSSALAIGVTAATLTTGMNTDISNYMFGSILAMSKEDVYVSVISAALVLTLYVLFYNKIFAVTFDDGFARATGVHSGVYNTLLAVLTAVTVVVGMRMMGALLISSIIVFPALSSMRICKRYKSVIVASAVISVISFITGLLLSFGYDVPTGSAVVLVNLVVFLALFGMGKLLKRD